MAQIFHPGFNVLSKLLIVGAVLLLSGLAVAAGVLVRSSYVTNQGLAVNQPVQFSHAHHVSGLGIDCRYCHTSVETSAYANIPPTKTCMNCHSQIWTGSPTLEPVRESYRQEKPIAWSRVHRIADFVYFDHSIHVSKGVGCVTCHGKVNEMQAVYQKGSLLMEWCLECHRAPENFVRPRDQVFNFEYKPEPDQLTVGNELKVKNHIRSLIECSTCHR